MQRQVQRPARELVTRSKLSCLAWSAQEQSQLIASDYEGIVTLWDAEVSLLPGMVMSCMSCCWWRHAGWIRRGRC